jgi:hypothetical protein
MLQKTKQKLRNFYSRNKKHISELSQLIKLFERIFKLIELLNQLFNNFL